MPKASMRCPPKKKRPENRRTNMISPAQDPYASRTDRSSAIIARQDPVVYGEGKYADALSADLVQRYEQDGFLLLENLFTEEEVQALANEVERMTRDPAIVRREEAITEPGSNAVRSIFMVHVLSPMLARLTRDPRLANVARQLLGSEVYIHQSRANLKPGFKGKEFYWHSDFETWHVEDGMPSMRALSCSVLLTDNNECNGPLMLVPGSHRQFISCVGETPRDHYKQSLKKQEYGVPDPVSLQLLVEQIVQLRAIEAVTPPDKPKVVEEAAPVAAYHAPGSALRGLCFRAPRVAGCLLVVRWLAPPGGQAPTGGAQVCDSRRVSDTTSS